MKFKNIIKRPFLLVALISILIADGFVSFVYLRAQDNRIEYKAEKDSVTKSILINEFNTYKQNVQTALDNDNYDKIDSYTNSVSKKLKQDTEFKMFVEDLNFLKETKKAIDDKSITDYDTTLDKLQMHSNTDVILKRKAEDYTRAVKELKEQATKEEASSTEDSQSEQNTEVSQNDQITEASNSQTEVTTTQNAEDPYDLVGTYVHGNYGDYRVFEYIKGYYVVATSIPTNYGSKSMYAIYDPEHQILEERGVTDSLTQVENYLGKW